MAKGGKPKIPKQRNKGPQGQAMNPHAKQIKVNAVNEALDLKRAKERQQEDEQDEGEDE